MLRLVASLSPHGNVPHSRIVASKGLDYQGQASRS